MPKDPLQAAKWEMVEAGGRTAQSFGLNRLLGQIYMWLYMSHEPACLDELAESLGVSKASVSIACRQLLSLGGLKRVWRKGDRRDFYEAETDLRGLLQNGLMREVRKKLESAKVQLDLCETMIAQAEGGQTQESSFLRARLGEAARYRKRIESLVNNPLVLRLIQ